jgi:hypothetical protein
LDEKRRFAWKAALHREILPWAMSEETVANLRRGYEAFNRGDASAAMGLATPDVEWGTTGTFPGLVGVYQGFDELLTPQFDHHLLPADGHRRWRIRVRPPSSKAPVE